MKGKLLNLSVWGTTCAFAALLNAVPASADPVDLKQQIEQLTTLCDDLRKTSAKARFAHLEQQGYDKSAEAFDDFAAWSIREGAAYFDLDRMGEKAVDDLIETGLARFKNENAAGPYLFVVPTQLGGTLAVHQPGAAGSKPGTLTCIARYFGFLDESYAVSEINTLPFADPVKASSFILKGNLKKVTQITLPGSSEGAHDTLEVQAHSGAEYKGDDRSVYAIIATLHTANDS